MEGSGNHTFPTEHVKHSSLDSQPTSQVEVHIPHTCWTQEPESALANLRGGLRAGREGDTAGVKEQEQGCV